MPLRDYVDSFVPRHIGPTDAEQSEMLRTLGFSSLEALTEATIPANIRAYRPLSLPDGLDEAAMVAELRHLASRNKLYRTYIGLGYYDTVTPATIQRNILENPGWYTQYTPYQAEISQGRLEALLNFQTLVIDLTGLEIANASLLDEGTAAAEAMHVAFEVASERTGSDAFFVAHDVFVQTLEVVRTRAKPHHIRIIVGDPLTFDFEKEKVFGALIQYPSRDGAVEDYRDVCARVHKIGGVVAVATDLLALTLLTPPGEFGADVALGNSQRFGVPLGFGGPHAAFFACKDEFKRLIPGRIVGVSKDTRDKPALRLALQTREQHIRREKATSNICTAQVLLAVVASMYAVYHGPKGLKRIAERVNLLTKTLAAGLRRLGYRLTHERFFDTLRVELGHHDRNLILAEAERRHINLRLIDATTLGVSLDETTTPNDVADLLGVFAASTKTGLEASVEYLASNERPGFAGPFARKSEFLRHPVFNSYHVEHEILRYIKRLESRDLSLTTSMIPLGSCTMKLNAAAEMLPLTWPAWGKIHPFAPKEQAAGYRLMIEQLADALKEITGFAGCSMQPNSGAQGEYAGLLTIRAYHEARLDGHRNVCLIPKSAHGTNPATAVMANYKVVVVATDDKGNVDVADLKAKAAQHSKHLACLMITYPSTHGVFEEAIRDICATIHSHGGLVYMDGANLNAQVGLCRPAEFGADVCHINLHKTFCIPHGGGGPGMGPICCAPHLVPYLPSHPLVDTGGHIVGPVSAAPFGSASILTISWAYIKLMGGAGLKKATQVAILNANYMAHRLNPHFPVLFTGTKGRVAHEFIIDLNPLAKTSHVTAEDVAKRLMDYGFHAPTLSFPVPGTLMIEPTESESKAELDRLCDALIQIRHEIREIETGEADATNNVLKNAPHTVDMIAADEWPFPYSRNKAAFPASWTKDHKYWPHVSRVNNVHGDRNLVCACPPLEAYTR